jgi:hypothetical protein
MKGLQKSLKKSLKTYGMLLGTFVVNASFRELWIARIVLTSLDPFCSQRNRYPDEQEHGTAFVTIPGKAADPISSTLFTSAFVASC